MTTPSQPTGPIPIDYIEERLDISSKNIISLDDRVEKLEKEVKSLRGMVFLSMKRKKNNG